MNRKLQNKSLDKETHSDTQGSQKENPHQQKKKAASDQSSAHGPMAILHSYKYSVK